MISWLDPFSTTFPSIDAALEDPNGLLAAGGDLSSERLISAYRHGIFPWYNPGEPILWWSPDPRCTLQPDQIRISRSLRKTIRRTAFEVCFDRDFPSVIKACAEPRPYCDATWISPEIKQAYIELHKLGVAHSVEVRIDGELAGGLYGIAMGKLFFGESMFSKQNDASKIAFAFLAKQLQKWDYALIDCQVHNEHLTSMGAKNISRKEFKQYLDNHLIQPNEHVWEFDIKKEYVVTSK
ncbi:MAG: leucyl/phenylalanyl-tRNA--protein transferase [Amphritea sp.]